MKQPTWKNILAESQTILNWKQDFNVLTEKLSRDECKDIFFCLAACQSFIKTSDSTLSHSGTWCQNGDKCF